MINKSFERKKEHQRKALVNYCEQDGKRGICGSGVFEDDDAVAGQDNSIHDNLAIY